MATLFNKREGRYSFDGSMDRTCYTEEDVKEFIRDIINNTHMDATRNDFIDVINKFAGKKLVKDALCEGGENGK